MDKNLYKVFETKQYMMKSGGQAVEDFLNYPDNYEGYEFVQVISVWSGGASILFKKKKEGTDG